MINIMVYVWIKWKGHVVKVWPKVQYSEEGVIDAIGYKNSDLFGTLTLMNS